MGFFNHLASDFLDTSAVGVSCLSALLDQCDFYFMVKKAIVDWKKLLISSIMNLVSLLFKLMDLNVQLIDLPKHMNNMDFPQRCQPYVYQGLSTLGIFSSSRKFQKTRNSSPNDGKPDSYKKGFVQHKTWIPAIGNNCMNQSETQPPKRKNRKQNLWENEKKKYPPPTRYP